MKKNANQTEVKLGSSIAFTAVCLMDILITTKIIPISLTLLRDETYKDGKVKSSIWKLRGLILANLVFSLGFLCWIWATYNGSTETKDQILKWFFIVVLAMGFIAIKIAFIKIYLTLKKYIQGLFVGFTMIKKDEPEIYSMEKIETIEPFQQLEGSADVEKEITNSNNQITTTKK